MRQGDMIDNTGFCALIVDKVDIMSTLIDGGLNENLANDKAQKFIESDYFRRKFTDNIMHYFWDVIELMTKDDHYLK